MKEDTGQILIVDKIVNNNIVIAKDFRGREVVAIGKGVGFRKRKNEAVHRSEIMKTWDEPLNYIDVYSRIQIEQLIRQFSPAMLLVEHDVTFQKEIDAKVITL